MARFQLWGIKSDKIFWTKNSVDKPNPDFFFNFVSRENINVLGWESMGNFTPNFINQFNAQITTNSDEYNYFCLYDSEKSTYQYFLVDGVNKILNTAYVLDITLDVFVTYTLPFLENIDPNFPILINRTSQSLLYTYNYKAMLSPDPLIDTTNWPVALVKVGYSFNNPSIPNRLYSTNLQSNPKVAFSELKNNNQDCELWVSNSNEVYFDGFGIGVNMMKGIFCDLYLTDDGFYFLAPLLDNNSTSGAFTWGEDRQNIFSFQIKNSKGTLQQLRTNGFWINKYKGRFYLPCAMWLANYGYRWHFIKNVISGVTTYTWCLEVEQTTDMFINYTSSPYFLLGDEWEMNFDNYVDPKGRYPNIYIKSKTCQLDNNTPLFYFDSRRVRRYLIPFTQDKGKRLHWNFYIDPTNGFEWVTRLRLDIAFSIKGFGTIPTTTSGYLTQQASIASQKNASLEASKVNLGMGIAGSLISGASSIGGAVASGNIFGGIMGGISSLFSIGSKIAQYKNEEKMRQAKDADAQRTATPNQFLPSSQKDTLANASAYYYSYEASVSIWNYDSIIVKTVYNKQYYTDPSQEFNEGDNLISYYNNFIWRVGYYINDYLIIQQFKDRYKIDISLVRDDLNKFIYWDMEIDEQAILNYYLYLNKEIQQAIITTINQPMRLWKEGLPDYSTILRFKQRDPNYPTLKEQDPQEEKEIEEPIKDFELPMYALKQRLEKAKEQEELEKKENENPKN